jgi:hypothetical protein
MPKVYNKRFGNIPKDAVYVGRPSKWGNPFKIGDTYNGVVLDRAAAVAQHRDWFLHSTRGQALQREARKPVAAGGLRGADVVCWCVPQDCHAYVLVEVANA